MASNRIIYQQQAVFVSNSPATGSITGLLQLHRVTSATWNSAVTRQDINQMGELAAVDRIILAAPTVAFDVGYHVSNVANEKAIGFRVDGGGSALQYLMDGTQNDKNYFVRIVPEGQDAVGYAGVDGGVVGIGNGFVSSWSAQGAVGSIPSATVKIEAANRKYDVGSSGIVTPAINPSDGSNLSYLLSVPTATSGEIGQLSALQPGQIVVDIGAAGLAAGVVNSCIQSFNISVDMRREPIQCLGSRFPQTRLITFPITASMDVEAHIQDFGTGNLSAVICNDASYNLTVTLYAPSCTGYGTMKAQYSLRGAKMDSDNLSTSIGPSDKVSMKFSTPIGGPNDTLHGLWLDGSIL